jgi:hypothetical protein
MNNPIKSSGLRPAPRPLRRRIAGQTLRHTALALSLLLWAGSAAVAQVSVGVSMPGVSIGINMPVYPQLVRVPNYPVYYAPGLRTNFFFYDGMYWVYQQDNWYASSWYNGPWGLVSPQAVPLYVLRVPVRYYRSPPTYFRGWRSDAPPRWGEHWGNEWSQQRSGWDRWDRRAAPAPAPLPVYQRQYSGNRYPHQVEQQQALHSRNYRYQPRDAVVRQSYQQQAAPTRAPDQQGRPAVQGRPQQPQPMQRAPQMQQMQQPQRPQQGVERREPPAPRANDRAQPAGRGASPGPEQAQRQAPGQGRGQDQAQGQGQGRGNGKAQGREHDRDNENDAGRQGRK